jgi:hypothetical protein
VPRDHYVAETYLKHFVRPGKMLQGYKKSVRKNFPCHPNDICKELDGDKIKDYLQDPNLLGKFRSLFERNWNAALNGLGAAPIGLEQKLALSGYWANLLVFTPTMRRIFVKIHDHLEIESLRDAATLRSEHDLSIAPLTGTLQDSGSLLNAQKAEPDAIRALLARSIMKYVWALYDANWIILKNETGISLLTSDNPVAFEDPGEQLRVGLPRFLPITPHLCLYCEMAPSLDDKAPDFSRRPRGGVQTRSLGIQGVCRINKAVVQCAGDLVISAEELPAISHLVAKYANFRVDVDFLKKRNGDAILNGSRLRVREQG